MRSAPKTTKQACGGDGTIAADMTLLRRRRREPVIYIIILYVSIVAASRRVRTSPALSTAGSCSKPAAAAWAGGNEGLGRSVCACAYCAQSLPCDAASRLTAFKPPPVWNYSALTHRHGTVPGGGGFFNRAPGIFTASPCGVTKGRKSQPRRRQLQTRPDGAAR